MHSQYFLSKLAYSPSRVFGVNAHLLRELICGRLYEPNASLGLGWGFVGLPLKIGLRDFNGGYAKPTHSSMATLTYQQRHGLTGQKIAEDVAHDRTVVVILRMHFGMLNARVASLRVVGPENRALLWSVPGFVTARYAST